jgi:hypothetical protein
LLFLFLFELIVIICCVESFSNADIFPGDRAGLAPIWNDEDERDFYEILPDLKSTMPSMAYKDSLKETDTSSAPSTEDALSILDAAIEADSAELLTIQEVNTKTDEEDQTQPAENATVEQPLSTQTAIVKPLTGLLVAITHQKTIIFQSIQTSTLIIMNLN